MEIYSSKNLALFLLNSFVYFFFYPNFDASLLVHQLTEFKIRKKMNEFLKGQKLNFENFTTLKHS